MKIIAHRGASGYAPENTLKAFELAVQMGSRDFEFDVHRTKDGVLVVHHDYALERTAHKKTRIANVTFEQLAHHNVALHRRGSGVHRVPRLAEVIDLIGPHADWLNFELKNDGDVYPGLEAQVLDFIKARGLLDRAVVSSFDYPTLRRLRSLSTEVKIGFLGSGLRTLLLLPALRRARDVGAEAVHLALRLAFGLNVSRIKRAGFKVRVYTVNRKEDAQRMQRIGVDGIFSNFPDILGTWRLKG